MSDEVLFETQVAVKRYWKYLVSCAVVFVAAFYVFDWSDGLRWGNGEESAAAEISMRSGELARVLGEVDQAESGGVGIGWEQLQESIQFDIVEGSSQQGTIQTRTRILYQEAADRWVRLEESFRVDPTSGERLLERYVPMVADRLLVKLSEDAAVADLENSLGALGFSSLRPAGSGSLYTLELTDFMNVKGIPDALAIVSSMGSEILFVEPDYLVRTLVVPSDPHWSEQWGFLSENGSGPNRDIDAPEAWSIRKNADGVKIAVVDTGIRLSHEDLRSNLWHNPSESDNGIDDDGNGYIDDLHGIDAISDSGDPLDDNGHGSHVAGIIGAEGNNGIGVAGVAWQCELMSLKFLDREGVGAMSDALECLEYAMANGADIINNSWGSSGRSILLEETLRRASDAGILIVTAAGNDGRRLAERPVYPAAYSVANQVVVAASDRADKLADFSNFDRTRVHLAAPFGAYSAYHSSDTAYEEAFGTSMAAPFVSGSLALLKAEFPEESAVALIDRLLQATEFRSSLAESVSSRGRLNLARSLRGETNKPANDNFEDAELIAGDGGFVSGALSFASIEASEPRGSENALGNTVWFRWQSEKSGRVSVISRSLSFRSVIAVYGGDGFFNLDKVAGLTEHTVSDAERFTFLAEEGQSYYFQVDRLDQVGGSFSLELQRAPENDDFSDAVVFSLDSFLARGNNHSAGVERSEPQVYPTGSGQTVWYTWTASVNGGYYASVESLERDVYLEVFSGATVADLERVDTTLENGYPSKRLFDVEAGETYRFSVDSLSRDGVNFQISGQYLSNPVISLQPTDKRVRLGNSALFQVRVFGGSPVYQWFKDGVAIEGANDAFWEIDEVTEGDVGEYHAEVRVMGRVLVSRKASLSIAKTASRFLSQPRSQVVLLGEPVSFSAFYSEVGEASYQWYKDGSEIVGAEESNLSISAAKISDSGFYKLVVTSTSGAVESDRVYLDVVEDSELRGISWIPGKLPQVSFRSIRSVNGYYVALGDDELAFSKDGVDWFYTSVPRAGYLKSIAYGNGVYMTGDSQGIAVSSDLKRWQHREGGPYAISQVAYFLGEFWLATSSGLYRTLDGDVVESVSVAAEGESAGISGIAYADGLLVATGFSGTYSSTDGLVWTKRSEGAVSNRAALHTAQGRWFAVDETGREVSYSEDGIQWQSVSLPEGARQNFSFDPISATLSVLTDVGIYRHAGESWEIAAPMKRWVYAFGCMGDTFVGSYQAGLGLLNGELADIPAPIYGHQDWWERAQFTYVGDRYIASGDHANTRVSEVRESKNGIDWNVVPSGGGATWGRLVYGNGKYLNFSNSGASLVSMSPHGHYFQGYEFGNGVFVAIDGKAMYSTDGDNWVDGVGFAQNQATRLMFAGDLFVASGFEVTFTSKDGKVWSQVPGGVSNLEYLAAGNASYVAMTSSGQSYISADGVNWSVGGRPKVTGVSAHIGGLGFYGNRFVCSYWNGMIFESVDGVSWALAHGITNAYSGNGLVQGNSSLLLVGDGMSMIGSEVEGALTLELRGPVGGSKVLVGNPIDIDVGAYSASGDDLSKVKIYIREEGKAEVLLPSGESKYRYNPLLPGDHRLTVRAVSESGVEVEEVLSFVAVSSGLTSLPQKLFSDIVYFEGALYAAGQTGTIFMTTDGLEWVTIQTPTFNDLGFFHRSSAGLCVTDERGGLLFSADGVIWNYIEGLDARNSSHESPEEFFSVPTGFHVSLLSVDGMNWFSARTGELVAGNSGLAYPEFETFFYGGSVYFDYPGGKSENYGLVVGSSSVLDYEVFSDYTILLTRDGVYKSVDGTEFEDVTPGPFLDDGPLGRICRVGEVLFLFSDNWDRLEFISSDGLTWERVAFDHQFISDPVYYDGSFYADCSGGFARSENGRDWELFGEPVGVGSGYLPSTLIATEFGFFAHHWDGPKDSTFAYSADGLEWTTEKVKYFTGITNVIGRGDSIFAPSGDRKDVYRLDSSGEWVAGETRMRPTVAYGNGIFVDVDFFGDTIYTSTDGLEWNNHSAPAWLNQVNDNYPILFDGKKYFWMTNEREYIGRSVDGISWDRIDAPVDRYLKEIVWFKERLYAGFEGNTYISSDEGLTWVKSELGSGEIAATETRLAILVNTSPNATLYTSRDGEFWTEEKVRGYNRFLAATSDAFYFGSSELFKTADGVNIETVTSIGANGGEAFAVGDRLFVVSEGLSMRELGTSDLAIENLTVQGGVYGVGDRIETTVTIKNNGQQPYVSSDRSRLVFVFSERSGSLGRPNGGAVYPVGLSAPAFTLEGGSTRDLEFALLVPGEIRSGSYYLHARLSDQFYPKDSNRTNDIFLGKGTAAIHVEGRTLSLEIEGLGEVNSSVSISSLARNQEVLLTPLAHVGHRFDGWSGVSEFAGDVLSLKMDTDLQLVAHFKPEVFEVSVEVQGPGEVDGIPSGQVEFGQELRLVARPSGNATFVGWSGDLESDAAEMRILVGEELRVRAEFSQSFSQWLESRYSESELLDSVFNQKSSDPDQNGISNLWEYLLAVPPGTTEKSDVLRCFVEDGDLLVRYTEKPHIVGYVVQPTVTGDLETFSSEGIVVSKISESGEIQLMEARVNLPQGESVLFVLRAIEVGNN